MFIVFEENVVPGLVFFDKVTFQDQRFGLGLGSKKFDITDLVDEYPHT